MCIRNYSRWSIVGLLVASVGLGAHANAQAARYSVTDLGTLGGATSKGYGVNASGQVTGEAATAEGEFHAFLYANGVMRDLNSIIDSTTGVHVTLISGKGINDHGWIVANGIDSRTGDTHAYLLSKR